MKTHVKLLVLAMVLVMFTFCLAACVGGGSGNDTTTEATTTTTAPVTTTTAGDLGYDPADFGVIVPEEVPYTGSTIDVVDVFKASGTKTSIKYALIDANENVIEELGTTKPVDCGTYKVTVTFSWTKNDKTDPLPAPMTAIFTVVPGSLDAVKSEFGAKNIDILFKATGMNFNPVGTAMQTGFLPDGIVSSASIVKIANAADTGAGTPVAEAGKITSADGAGYFRVTFTYAEEAGLNNYTDEATVSYSAVVYARAIEKTVAKVATAPTMTGDLSQYGAALFESQYQAAELKDGKTVLGPDTDSLVNPYLKAAALQVSRGANVTADMINAAASAKFYAVWDGEFVYIAIEVTDTTEYARSANYTAQPNPWVNDNLELYYSFGGDAVPDVSNVSETYPTYKTVVRDSIGGVGGHTAIKSQQSHYFADIVCNVTGRDVTDNGTYIIEYKFPAKSESWSGTPGAAGDAAFKTAAGSALAAGDFIYLAYQLNDLMGAPFKRLTNGELDFLSGTLSETERWDNIAAYDANINGTTLPSQKYGGNAFATSASKDSPWYNFEMDAAAYVYSAGNRSVGTYLKQDGCAPMILQLGQ